MVYLFVGGLICWSIYLSRCSSNCYDRVLNVRGICSCFVCSCFVCSCLCSCLYVRVLLCSCFVSVPLLKVREYVKRRLLVRAPLFYTIKWYI